MKKSVVWILCLTLIAGLVSMAAVAAPITLTDSDVTITGITAQIYTGYPIAPSPRITYNGTSLVNGRDYSLSYQNNVLAGSTASVTISFMGDYAGEIVKPFVIVPVPSSGAAGGIMGGSTISANAITVVQSGGGTVTCENTKAMAGVALGFSAAADEGYYVINVAVIDSTGASVAVTNKGGGLYSFKMPSRPVVISAEFSTKAPETDSGVTTAPQTPSQPAVPGADGITPVTPTDIPNDPQPPETFKNPFTDVSESDYFYDPVIWAYKNNVTTGMTDVTFVPTGSCTRGQTVTFLWRAMGSPEPASQDNPFADVSPSDYFYKPVLWAVEQGITLGTSSTEFSPSAVCTRGQVVTFLYRASSGSVTTAATAFTDVDTSAYYASAVSWAVEKGVTNGVTATTFAPDNNCVRGQIVTFIYRALAK